MSPNPQTPSQAGDVTGSVSEKPCSNCGKPRDQKGRYCKDCRATYMRGWRKGRVSVPIDGPFHVKPFVNELARAKFAIREEDDGFVILYDGSPMRVGEVECREEAERIIDTLCEHIVPLSHLIEAAARHFQGDGEFAEG